MYVSFTYTSLFPLHLFCFLANYAIVCCSTSLEMCIFLWPTCNPSVVLIFVRVSMCIFYLSVQITFASDWAIAVLWSSLITHHSRLCWLWVWVNVSLYSFPHFNITEGCQWNKCSVLAVFNGVALLWYRLWVQRGARVVVAVWSGVDFSHSTSWAADSRLWKSL